MSLLARLSLRTTSTLFPRNLVQGRSISSQLLQNQSFVRRYTSGTPSAPPAPPASSSQEKPPEPRLSLTFTCTVPDCSHRSTHEFSKASYERGIVLVQCPKCKNRHLIADHLGWFKEHEGTAGGTLRTIEDLMRAKGEKVTRGRLDAGGVVEYIEE